MSGTAAGGDEVTYDQYIDSIINQTHWRPDLTPEQIAAERAEMRSRVIADIEASVPRRVVERWKADGLSDSNPFNDNPGFEVHGQV